MFLSKLVERNPAFIDVVAQLHGAGDLPSNTYVIDLDSVRSNSDIIHRQASELGLTTFAMTKQMGRNPDFCKAVAQGGIESAVAVDLECAWYSYQGGLTIGHLGHLVQVPRAEVTAAMSLAPRYWTVMSKEQAELVSKAAVSFGREQEVLLRVTSRGDRFYRGHEGGFDLNEITAVADSINALTGLQVAGTTSFPAVLFDKESQQLELTPNAGTIQSAAFALEEHLGRPMQRNMPGTTSSASLAMVANAGATQVEPGHGLTGTTPLHAVSELPEVPAALYVSEVSHHWNDEAFIIGGGTYRDPVLGDIPTNALAFAPDGSELGTYEVQMPDAAAIDYTCIIAKNPDRPLPPVGSTVIFGFRIQAFVTRAQTVGIEGVHSGEIRIGMPYAALGSPSFLTALNKNGDHRE